MIFGLSILDVGIILCYIAIIVYLGWRAKRKVHSTEDYFMGGRKGNKIVMVANALGAGTHTDQAIAVAGATYSIGLAGIWYQWVYLFATPFYWLLAPIYRRVRFVTTGDYFEHRYGAKVGAAYSIMGFLYFVVNLGLILKGTGTAIEAATGGQISSPVIVIVLTLFFLGYSVLGGLVSALNINVIQGVFILILSFLLIPFALEAGGGITAIKEKLPDYMFSFVAPKEVTLFFIIMIVINGLIGIVVQPHHMAVGGSGKTEMSSRMGWTFGNFMKRIATLGWAFVGVFAAVLFPGFIGDDRELAFGTAVSHLLPSGLVGLMIAAMAAAVLAVCHNYMVAGSALFTRNFYKKFFEHTLTEKREIQIARWAAISIVIGGVSVAMIVPSVVKGIQFLWQIEAYFGIGFWIAIFWRRSNRYGVWASITTAVAVTLITGSYLPFSLGWAYEYQIVAYLPAGIAAFFIASLLTTAEPEKQVHSFYLLLHTPVGDESRLEETHSAAILTESELKAQEENSEMENNGNGLLLVDLFSLHKKFSFARYRTDIIGLSLSILFVFVILGIGFFTAHIG